MSAGFLPILIAGRWHPHLDGSHPGLELALRQVTVLYNAMPPAVVLEGLTGGHSHSDHRFRSLRQQGLHATAQDSRDYVRSCDTAAGAWRTYWLSAAVRCSRGLMSSAPSTTSVIRCVTSGRQGSGLEARSDLVESGTDVILEDRPTGRSPGTQAALEA